MENKHYRLLQPPKIDNRPIYLQTSLLPSPKIEKEKIIEIKKKIEENFPDAKIVYEDSDSVFLTFNTTTNEAIRQTKELSQMLNSKIEEKRNN